MSPSWLPLSGGAVERSETEGVFLIIKLVCRHTFFLLAISFGKVARPFVLSSIAVPKGRCELLPKRGGTSLSPWLPLRGVAHCNFCSAAQWAVSCNAPAELVARRTCGGGYRRKAVTHSCVTEGVFPKITARWEITIFHKRTQFAAFLRLTVRRSDH